MTIKDRQWYKRFKRDEFKGTHNNAMFKGQPFIIDGSDLKTGRRTVEHKFPQRDEPYTEDLGKETRVFSVGGILLGDDYLTQRDGMLTLCEEDGPGELIHPYYGIMDVYCKAIHITDVMAETRKCTFQAIFVEAGELVFPITSEDTTTQVEVKVESTLANIKAFFVEQYDKVQKAVAYLEGKQDATSDAFDAINGAKKLANMPATYFAKYQELSAVSDTLALSGQSLSDAIVDLVTFGFLGLDEDEDINNIDAFNGLKESMDFTTDTTIPSDDTDLIEALTQLATVTSMCLLISRIDYVSVDDAKEYQTVAFDKLDELMDNTLDDTIMQDLRDLRAVVTKDLDIRSLDLPELSTHTTQRILPALVISNMLYGSVEQEQDILDRNKIEHPAFCPASVPLEVLLNA